MTWRQIQGLHVIAIPVPSQKTFLWAHLKITGLHVVLMAIHRCKMKVPLVGAMLLQCIPVVMMAWMIIRIYRRGPKKGTKTIVTREAIPTPVAQEASHVRRVEHARLGNQ